MLYRVTFTRYTYQTIDIEAPEGETDDALFARARLQLRADRWEQTGSEDIEPNGIESGPEDYRLA